MFIINRFIGKQTIRWRLPYEVWGIIIIRCGMQFREDYNFGLPHARQQAFITTVFVTYKVTPVTSFLLTKNTYIQLQMFAAGYIFTESIKTSFPTNDGRKTKKIRIAWKIAVRFSGRVMKTENFIAKHLRIRIYVICCVRLTACVVNDCTAPRRILIHDWHIASMCFCYIRKCTPNTYSRDSNSRPKGQCSKKVTAINIVWITKIFK